MDGLSVPSHGFKLLGGTANRPLAEEMARHIGVELCKLTLSRFADGEIFVRIDENVRGNDVFIIQPTNPPAENLLETLLLIDAAKRASAARVTVVMPYYGYSRQDRKDQPRVAIGAKLVANMIQAAGANRVLGIDFHQHQLQGFFDIPVDHLYAMPVFTAHYRKKQLRDIAVVAPDVGSAKMARGFAKRLDASLAIIDKRRTQHNVSEVMNVVGEVEGMDCILVDDMIDTAGTVSEASHALKKMGAKDVYVCATHALLSGPARERLMKAPIKEVAVTNTVAIPAERQFDKLMVLSVGDLLAKAVRLTHAEQSVSSLFEEQVPAGV
jgi:ribose-phosphate pyrophosphokinase